MLGKQINYTTHGIFTKYKITDNYGIGGITPIISDIDISKYILNKSNNTIINDIVTITINIPFVIERQLKKLC